MSSNLDTTRAVRAGEELDPARLETYLSKLLPDARGEPRIRQFRGGYSNLTYQVTMGGREFVLRCPPNGKKSATAHDMAREFNVLKHLRPQFSRCPEVFGYCDDLTVLGKPFYVMEKMPGVILRKENIRAMGLSARQFSQVCESVVDVHAELHRIDYTRLPQAATAKPHGYVARQVEGWCERYDQARTPNSPRLTLVKDWLRKHLPCESGQAALIHNDFKLDNLLLDPTRKFTVTGVLDWEMSTIGDPLMDLGCSLGYWVEKNDPWYLRWLSPMPTTVPGAWTRQEIVRRYAERTGLDVSRMNYFYVFGLFRIAGIAQQIYYRYYHRQTRDKRFRSLILGVYALEATAKRAIRAGRLP